MTQDPGAADVPLARLVAMAYQDLVEALHDGLRERGWSDVRPVYGFVLLAARDRPTSPTEVGALTGTTKQAGSKLVDQMVAAGYLERQPDERDRRVVRVALSERGQALLRDVEKVYAEVEGRWADVVGVRAVERLRRDLDTVLRARHGGDLPPVRRSW